MLLLLKPYVVTSHQIILAKTVLKRGHNIWFNGEIRMNISELSSLPVLIWSSDNGLPSLSFEGRVNAHYKQDTSAMSLLIKASYTET